MSVHNQTSVAHVKMKQPSHFLVVIFRLDILSNMRVVKFENYVTKYELPKRHFIKV